MWFLKWSSTFNSPSKLVVLSWNYHFHFCRLNTQRWSTPRQMLPMFCLWGLLCRRKNSEGNACCNKIHKKSLQVYYYFQRNRTDENLSESSRRYPKMCCTCKKHLKQSLLRSREGSDCDQSNMSSCRQCTCRRKEKLSSLAQQLHQKLSRTLDVNTNFFQKCIDCGDVVG